MIRSFIVVTLFFFFVTPGFAQQSSNFRVTGVIPGVNSQEMYNIQVGAFLDYSNAEKAHERLRAVNLNPVYENFNNLTRVMVICSARDVHTFLGIIRNAGFNDVYIRRETSFVSFKDIQYESADESSDDDLADLFIEEQSDKLITYDSLEDDNLAEETVQPQPAPAVRPVDQLPLSISIVPPASLREVAAHTIRIGETKSLIDLVQRRDIASWNSSTPSVVTVNQNGYVTGRNLGNAYILINEIEYISIAVVPRENFFVVPESLTSRLSPETARADIFYRDFTEYRTEPTFRLAYRFNNRREQKGASGRNGGIDILTRGPGYRWLWTTFYQGGWFYDLNGVKHDMIDGFQRGANGVTLTLLPEFVYDNGVTYLQLKHILHNTNNFSVSGQRFGASADVMIYNNDYAALVLTPYGAYMTDNPDNPSVELRFICLAGNGINPVSTLWLGGYNNGDHINHIYNDRRTNVYNSDSAIGFSYQNINLSPGEKKEFVVRFTVSLNENNADERVSPSVMETMEQSSEEQPAEEGHSEEQPSEGQPAEEGATEEVLEGQASESHVSGVQSSREHPLYLSIGSEVDSNLHNGGEVWFRVRPSLTGFMIIETLGDLDTYMTAYDSSFISISENDDGGEDFNSRLSIVAEPDKDYFFKVTGYNNSENGSFRIKASMEQPVVLGVGTVVQGNLNNSDSLVVYTVKADRSGSLIIETSGDTDVNLTVYDANKIIASDDDSGVGYNACVVLDAQADKTYMVVLRGLVTGSYSITAKY